MIQDYEKNKVLFSDLFSYLEEYIKFGDGKTTPMSATCNGTLDRVWDFCQLKKLDFYKLKEILVFFGGHCDCEVLLNVSNSEKMLNYHYLNVFFNQKDTTLLYYCKNCKTVGFPNGDHGTCGNCESTEIRRFIEVEK